MKRVLVFSTIAISAFFIAQGTTTLWLAPDELPPMSFPDVPPPERDIDPNALARLFEIDAEPVRAETCDEELRLIAAVVGRQGAIAAISGPDGATTGLRVGSRIGDREVVAIERERIVVRLRSGTECGIAMHDRRVAHAGSAEPVPSIEDAIRRDGALVRVRRSYIESVTREQAGVLDSPVRAIPYERDGRTIGVRIYGIRRGSALARVGLANGDLLRSINGRDASDVDGALALYGQLPTLSHLTVGLERAGQPITIEVEID